MAFYDVAGNMQHPQPVAAYMQGVQYKNALRDLAAKRAEESRQTEIRNGLMQFYRGQQPAVPASLGKMPNPLESLMAKGQGGDAFSQLPGMDGAMGAYQPEQPAKPAGMDYQGAADYLASRGEFEQAGALGKLRALAGPQSLEWTGVIRDAEDGQGNPVLLGMTNQGPRPIEGYRPKPEMPKVDVKGGWIMGADGQPERPLPMTPAEEARQAAERERLRLAQEAADRAAEEARANRGQKDAKIAQEKAGKYQAVNDLDSVLSAYEEALKGASRVDLLNPASDKAIALGSLATQLQMAYKTAADLGAITGPDWAIINRIIATPSGAKAALIGSEGLLQQVGEVRKLSTRQRQQLDKVYGADPTVAAPARQQPIGRPSTAASPKPATPGQRPSLNDIFGGQ